jgi:hypothetical protein
LSGEVCIKLSKMYNIFINPHKYSHRNVST